MLECSAAELEKMTAELQLTRQRIATLEAAKAAARASALSTKERVQEGAVEREEEVGMRGGHGRGFGCSRGKALCSSFHVSRLEFG